MRTNVKRISVVALFVAVIMVTTAYVKIPIGFGYIHVGDIFIMLSCFFLPIPLCLTTGVIAATLADLIAGYVTYMPITAFAKMLLVIFCRLAFRKNKPKIWEMIVFPIIGNALMVTSYFIFEGFYYGWAASIANLPMQLIQPAISIPVAIVTIFALMKIPYLMNNRNELTSLQIIKKRKVELSGDSIAEKKLIGTTTDSTNETVNGNMEPDEKIMLIELKQDLIDEGTQENKQ